ncbi:Periplasmic copper-binding protein (NosD) [uncultured archaeon]|nr:Periplasmic copper-binding protein (NosD) [uncultured archaeon]
MNKKCYTIAIGMILLFIGMSIIPSTAEVKEKSSLLSSDGTWWYVGGSGPGNYTRIQDAINAASDGDTVFVYRGIYTKNNPYDQVIVNVNKRIRLIGEDKNTTILKGSGKYKVVIVSANGVVISGFTVQESGADVYPGSGIFIDDCRDIIIDNNIFLENPNCALYCVSSNNCSFSHNIFRKNGFALYIASSVNCSVFSNLFISNSNGIDFDFEFERLIDIYSNEFKDNEKGVTWSNSQGVAIRLNNFIGNKVQATFFNYGGLLDLGSLIGYKQNWSSNYWSNWKSTSPKPIRGKIELYIPVIPLVWIKIPLLSFDYDRTPVQEPYNISVYI